GGAHDEGVIFELSPAGKTWTQTILYSFCANTDCKDGEIPAGPLTMDLAGNLFGVAASGGANGDGVIFKLVPNGTQSQFAVLRSFCSVVGCADGGYPYGSLALDSAGSIFGTTQSGGSQGFGTVYRLSG